MMALLNRHRQDLLQLQSLHTSRPIQRQSFLLTETLAQKQIGVDIDSGYDPYH